MSIGWPGVLPIRGNHPFKFPWSGYLSLRILGESDSGSLAENFSTLPRKSFAAVILKKKAYVVILDKLS